MNIVSQTSINTGIAANTSTSTLSNYKLIITPNPANNQVSIVHDLDNAKPVYIAVFNATGQQVISQVLNRNLLNVSKLPNGLYLLQLKQDKNTRRTKLLIQR